MNVIVFPGKNLDIFCAILSGIKQKQIKVPKTINASNLYICLNVNDLTKSSKITIRGATFLNQLKLLNLSIITSSANKIPMLTGY